MELTSNALKIHKTTEKLASGISLSKNPVFFDRPNLYKNFVSLNEDIIL